MILINRNTGTFRFVVQILSLLAVSALPAIAHSAISTERVSSSQADVWWVAVDESKDSVAVFGELRRTQAWPKRVPGYLEIEVLNAQGEAVEVVRTDYRYRRFGRSNGGGQGTRRMSFFTELPVTPPQGGTIRVVHRPLQP